ncbi:MAG: TMEM175 family protein [Candidatus Omnitrophica bacterium]|nr:TMEM175 family protein [Candidatus Omnitrophota bacterium]
MKFFREIFRSGGFSTHRLDAFSDGVFAIVITLLVLELRIPEVTGEHLSHELKHGLKELLPKFISFVVSFLYISIYWINHQQLFHLIKKFDRGIFWLNSLFLMCLTFIPFPTALIGSYPHERIAVIFYGVAMMATALSFVLMKMYILSREKDEHASSVKHSPIYLLAGPVLYLLAVLLAMVNISFAIAIYLLIPVIYLFAKIETDIPSS